MFGRAVNVLGSLMIWWTDNAVQTVPRSDRKSLRAKRPTYGKRRAAVAKPIRTVAMLRRGRRCAPRLTTKPAMFMMGGKLLAHPALRRDIERHLGVNQ